MQPTVPSWVSWYRRVRARGHEARSQRPRAHNRIAVYSFPDDSATRLIRLNSMMSRNGFEAGVGVTPAGEAWQRDHYPIDTEPWRVPMPMLPHFKPVQPYLYEPISIVLPAESVTVAPPSQAHGWGGAARGWAAGTVLLALLVLLVRSAEKCLDRKLFRLRRRQSEEWPTPNVLATSHQNNNSTDSQTRDPEAFPDVTLPDLPPPYSECAGAGSSSDHNNVGSAGPSAGRKSSLMEEPPPPYSACYVAFTEPKDGIPSVHYSNRQQEDPSCSNIPNSHDANTELVFENGRIVQRQETVCANEPGGDMHASPETCETLETQESLETTENCEIRETQESLETQTRDRVVLV